MPRPRVELSATTRRLQYRVNRWQGFAYLTLIPAAVFPAVFPHAFCHWWGVLLVAVFFVPSGYCIVRSNRTIREFKKSLAVDRAEQGIPAWRWRRRG
jgi:hypothetical protein